MQKWQLVPQVSYLQYVVTGAHCMSAKYINNQLYPFDD